MHERFFSLMALPEPPRLLGLQLRPYSLGHELHLWRRNSSFLLLDFAKFDALPEDQQRAALMLAVHVCSQDYGQNCRASGGWWWWEWVTRRCGVRQGVAALRGYLVEARQEFKATVRKSEGGQVRFLGAPELLRLYQFVCDTVPDRELALYSRGRRVSAWDYPFGLAKLQEQARNEMAGSLEIYNHFTKTHEDYVAEMEAERIKAESEPNPGLPIAAGGNLEAAPGAEEVGAK